MEAALFVFAFGWVYFLTFGFSDVVKTYMEHKIKIAESNRKAADANRDAAKYELEKARVYGAN